VTRLISFSPVVPWSVARGASDRTTQVQVSRVCVCTVERRTAAICWPSETTEALKYTAQIRRSRSPSGSNYSRLMMFGSRCRYHVPCQLRRGHADSPDGRLPSRSVLDNRRLAFHWNQTLPVTAGERRITSTSTDRTVTEQSETLKTCPETRQHPSGKLIAF